MTRKTHAERWATAARWVVAFVVLAASGRLELDTTWPGAILTFALAAAAFWALKLKARRQRQRRMDAAELRSSLGAIGKKEI